MPPGANRGMPSSSNGIDDRDLDLVRELVAMGSQYVHIVDQSSMARRRCRERKKRRPSTALTTGRRAANDQAIAARAFAENVGARHSNDIAAHM